MTVVPGYPGWTNLVFGNVFSGRKLPPKILVNYHSAMSTMPMCTNGVTIEVYKSPVDFARNHICREAKKLGAKYVIFWDEDVLRPPQTTRELVYRMDHTPDAAVIGGIVCLKTDPAEPMTFRKLGHGPFWDFLAGEFFEVDGIGMGATIIRVAALEDIEEPWFKTVSNYEQMLEGVPAGESWTEDLFFCDRIKKTGKWKIYADASILCGHVNLETEREYGLPPDSKPMRHLLVPKGTKKILDIGSGSTPYQTKEGKVVTFDLDEKHNPDYRGDCRRLPFGTGSFDIVHSAHLLEHFPTHETDEIMKEWARVVKPKGELRLTVLNLEWVAEQVRLGKVDDGVMSVLYGNQNDVLQVHRTTFTPKMIEAKLKALGFKKMNFKLENWNIHVQAFKGTGK